MQPTIAMKIQTIEVDCEIGVYVANIPLQRPSSPYSSTLNDTNATGEGVRVGLPFDEQGWSLLSSWAGCSIYHDAHRQVRGDIPL